MAHRHSNLLVGDQIFKLQLGALVTICVRRASPYLSRISSSSFTMTARSFISLARIDSYSAIRSRTCFNSFSSSSMESCVSR